MPEKGKFLCLCPSKAVQLVEDTCVRRDDSDEIKRQLNDAKLGGDSRIVLCLPGGGIAAQGFGIDPELAISGPLLAVLSGTISNYAYLIRKYFVEELGYARNVTLEAIRQSTPIRDAVLLCKLYERLGTGMLPKLRGAFCFCLYDSTTVRVLAATDPTCTDPMVQGITKDGALFVASGGFLPEGASSVVEIEPGMFKYGWCAPPRKYATAQDLLETSAAAASSAARAALSGIKVDSKPKGKKSGKGPQQKENAKVAMTPEGPKLRTKQEIRAWSAHLAQEAIKEYENGLESEGGFAFVDPTASSLATACKKYGHGKQAQRTHNWMKHLQGLDHGMRGFASGALVEDGQTIASPSQFKPHVLAALLGRQSGSETSSSEVTRNTQSLCSGAGVSSGQGQSSAGSDMTTSESSGSLDTESPQKEFTSVKPSPHDAAAASSPLGARNPGVAS